jgi:hypothetical protein
LDGGLILVLSRESFRDGQLGLHYDAVVETQEGYSVF